MGFNLTGRNFTKAETADRIEYLLLDTDLPPGCTHTGTNRIFVDKAANNVTSITHQLCVHFSDRPNGWVDLEGEIDPEILTVVGTPLPGGGATVDSGVIVMWSGLLINIPSGWVLCDGTNGTPDLRDKFIKGAAPLANPGATGGATSHTHSDHTGIINHTHPITDPGHTHVEQNNSATTGALAGWAARDTSTNTPVATGYSTQSSVTNISVNNPAGGVSSYTHDTVSNEPVYYSLAFIMKT